MGNEIIRAMAAKLAESFGGGYNIKTDNFEQEVQTPCFFLALIHSSESSLAKNRYQRQYTAQVRYRPTAAGDLQEQYQVAERLLEDLEWLSLTEGTIRGRNMEWQLVEGELEFQVCYSLTVTKSTAEVIDAMADLEIRTEG